MAYNTYFPYPGYYSPYQQTVQQQAQQTVQQSGFISVRSMEEAFNWPMAPGTSLTFKDESAPYIYTKTKGFSQLEQPIFERFRLVKEEQAPEKPSEGPVDAFDAKGEINTLWEEVRALKTGLGALEEALEALKRKPKKQTPSKEENEGES